MYNAISTLYPEFKTKEIKSTNTALTKISKGVGGVLGAITGMVAKPVAKVATSIEEKKEELYEQRISKETKSKWELVKQRAS